MRKNCEQSALSKMGITKDAHQAYKNLKAHYECKMVTDLGVLLASIVNLSYDNRLHTIEDHIEEFWAEMGLHKGNSTYWRVH